MFRQPAPPPEPTVDGGMVVRGIVVGLLVGAAVALWKAPVSGKRFRRRLAEGARQARQRVGQRVERVVPTDPVSDSLEAGRAAARRRLELPASR